MSFILYMTKYPAILQAGLSVVYCLTDRYSGDNLTYQTDRYSIVIDSRDNQLLHINIMQHIYTVVEKKQNGERIKCKGYDIAKKTAIELKAKTGVDCNVCSDGIAVWSTVDNSNTDAIYFL